MTQRGDHMGVCRNVNGRSAVVPNCRSDRVEAFAREARMLPVVLSLLAYLVGLFAKPTTLTSNRVGYSILAEASRCHTLEDCADLGLPGGLFGFISIVFPFAPATVLEWDALFALIGSMVIMLLALWVSRCPWLARWHALLFAAAVGLSSIYVFILSKDVVQVFVFLIIFALMRGARSGEAAILCAVLLFFLEGIFWRRYYLIVAVFVPIAYIVLSKVAAGSVTKREALITVIAFVTAALAFACVIKVISPDNYVEIVKQHGTEREDYTATVAASGIKSVIAVDASSPVYLFVANWAINTVRLLVPIELFAKGPYYWMFVIYQLAITVGVLTTIARTNDARVRTCLAVYLAFVIASGTFEPDFGSWVRHETACLPFLLVGITGYLGRERDGTIMGTPIRALREEECP